MDPNKSGYNSHMKKLSIAKLKNDLSAHLDYVRKGGRIQVMDRDQPVAEILPFTKRDDDAFVDQLLGQGIARPPGSPFPKDFWNETLPAIPGGESTLAVLLEERKKGR